MENELLKKEYQAVISKVEEKLSNDETWEEDYRKKINNLLNNRDLCVEASKRLSTKYYLQKNLQVNNASKINSDSKVTINLKYKGVDFGDVDVDISKRHGEDVVLKRKRIIDTTKPKGYVEATKEQRKPIAWTSKEATAWRVPFKKNVAISVRPEAQLENYLNRNLNNYGRIKEIKLFDRFVFQMPTRVGGARLHTLGETENLSNSGHIDLLARTGEPGSSKLTILELKDKYEENEPPELAIKQALAYATFIHSLLRSKNAGGCEWYHLFGLGNGKRKEIPKKLKLKVYVIMPKPDSKKDSVDLSFINIQDLKFGTDTNDSIELGCALLEKNEKGDWEAPIRTWIEAH